MNKPQINSKSIARIAAVQTLYQFASHKGEQDVVSLLLKMKEFYKDTDLKSDHDLDDKEINLKLKPSYSYLEDLVKHTYDNLAIIDEIISTRLAKEWNLTTLPILLHALLRVAICELRYFPETPEKVVLNEYTDIAGDMLAAKEVGFVNSILHTCSLKP